MKSRFSAVAAAVALTLAFGVAADAQGLSAREVKRIVKQAERAYGAGRYGEAIELYDQVLASTSGSDPRRGEALYASSMIRLAPESEERDVTGARQQLDELAKDFPRHPRRLEISIVRSLIGGLQKARADVRRSAAELEEKTAVFEAERQRVEAERQEAAGQSQAAGGRVKSLRSQLSKARAEAEECQAELETKEEALQKLRDALVGGSR